MVGLGGHVGYYTIGIYRDYYCDQVIPSIRRRATACVTDHAVVVCLFLSLVLLFVLLLLMILYAVAADEDGVSNVTDAERVDAFNVNGGFVGAVIDCV